MAEISGRRFSGGVAAGILLAVFATPASAQANPQALNKLLDGTAEDMVVEALGKNPLGFYPVVGYKVIDFAREIGVAAVDMEDQTRGAEIILMNADAALLHGLVANGEGNGPKAEAAKARLRTLRDQLDSGDASDRMHLLDVTDRHFRYGLGRASMKLALKLGFTRFIKSDPVMRYLRNLRIGKLAPVLAGNRGALQPWLRAAGWTQFAARSRAMERAMDKVQAALLDRAVDDYMHDAISKAAADALHATYNQVMFDHPPAPLFQRRMRLELVLRPMPYVVPATAVPVIPDTSVAALAPVPVDARLLRVEDPVARAISVEDAYSHGAWQAPESSEPTTLPPEPQPPPEIDEPSPRDLEFHQELMCAGAGNKAGCERWNSSSEANVEGDWDGRSGGSLYER